MLAAGTSGRASENLEFLICFLRFCSHTQVLHLYYMSYGQSIAGCAKRCNQFKQRVAASWQHALTFPISASRWDVLAERLMVTLRSFTSNFSWPSCSRSSPLPPAAEKLLEQAPLAACSSSLGGKIGHAALKADVCLQQSASLASSVAFSQKAQQSNCPHAGSGLTAPIGDSWRTQMLSPAK